MPHFTNEKTRPRGVKYFIHSFNESLSSTRPSSMAASCRTGSPSWSYTLMGQTRVNKNVPCSRSYTGIVNLAAEPVGLTTTSHSMGREENMGPEKIICRFLQSPRAGMAWVSGPQPRLWSHSFYSFHAGREYLSPRHRWFFFFNHGLDSILCAHLSWPLPPTYPTQSSCLHSPASSNANKTRGISDWWNLTDCSRDW